MATATKKKVSSKVETVRIGEVELPKFKPAPEDKVYVPPITEYERYADPNGVLEQIAWAFANGEDVLALGKTGTGKTHAFRAVAAALNQPYRRFPMHEATDASALLGKPQLRGDRTVFQDGKLTDSVKKSHLFVGDEYNQAHADARVVVNPLHANDEGVLIVEENEGEVIPRGPEFRFGATGNPYEYGGTKEWGAQIMSRFDTVIEVDYLPEDVEVGVLREVVPGLAADVAVRMVQAGNAVREAADDERVQFPLSLRELTSWGRKADTFGLATAAEIAVLNKVVDPLERDGVRELLSSHFGVDEWNG